MQRSSLAILAIGVALLIALFMAFKPKAAVAPTSNQNSTTQQASSSATTSNLKSFNLVVKNNKLVSGPESLQVTQGDTVTINITADVDGELHLHGYDKAVEFKANQPSSLTISANITGRFPYELEDTKTEIGALEVLPH